VPDAEGPWTKAGVIIAVAIGVPGLIIAYLGLAFTIHWVPFPDPTPTPRGLAAAATSSMHTSLSTPTRSTNTRPSPTISVPTSSATAVVGNATSLAGEYYGNITYQGGVPGSKFELCSVDDTHGDIAGQLIIFTGPGGGKFSGTFEDESHFTFTVNDASGEDGPMIFAGSMAKSGTISGTYIITNPRQQGSWTAQANQPFSLNLC